MKHIITAVLLALAVAAGLLLPEVFMEWKDRELETPKLISVTEPTLEWAGQGTKAELEGVTGEELAQRLTLFENGTPISVPLGTATTDEVLWAGSRAIEFLNMLFEVEPGISNSGAEYQLAWFEDGTTVPFWTAWVEFNGNWRCIMTMDGESGAILQCVINPNEQALAELFPESFERAGGNPDAHFEREIAQRFCDTLCFFMGRNDGGETPVWLPEEAGIVCIAFEDASDVFVEANLRVDILGGIWFNQP